MECGAPGAALWGAELAERRFSLISFLILHLSLSVFICGFKTTEPASNPLDRVPAACYAEGFTMGELYSL